MPEEHAGHIEFRRPDKARPALVLTRSTALRYLDTVTVAPITRTIRGVPSEVALGVEEGLKEPSAANFHALQTVAKDRIGRYVGSVDVARKGELREALLFALNLDEP